MDQEIDFDTVYTTYWEKVYRLCLGYVNDAELARDMAQETFAAVWQQLHSFRNEASVGTWIYKIAVNRCLRQLQQNSRRPDPQIILSSENNASSDIEQQTILLYQFISELPELDRIIISLELDDIKQQEIARITGLSEVNVRQRIYRIKKQLTQKFSEHGY